MEEILLQISAIYVAGITGLYKGIPVGLALNAHPVLIAGFTALGCNTTVLFLFFAGEPVRNWIISKIGKDKLEKRKGKFTRIMDRYGTIGLGLIVSGILGPITSVLIGLAIVPDTRRLLVFLLIGMVIWSIILTTIGVLGIDIIRQFLN
jgi:hypothetical protein